jgi:hypothetical protein
MKLQMGEPPAGPRGRKAARKAAFLLANTLDQWSEGRLARLGKGGRTGTPSSPPHAACSASTTVPKKRKKLSTRVTSRAWWIR